MADAMARFLSHVSLEPNSGCWLWMGGLDSSGYSKLNVNGKTTAGHVFSFVAHRGSVPEGMELDHKCRIRSCVNPWHVEPATHAENMHGADFANRKKTHCPRGHEYSPDNTRVYGGSRTCMKCAGMTGNRGPYKTGGAR